MIHEYIASFIFVHVYILPVRLELHWWFYSNYNYGIYHKYFVYIYSCWR